MAKYRWEDRERIRTSIGSEGLLAHVCWFLGMIFAVLGFIGDAVNLTVGLESTSWLLLSIAAFLSGVFPSIGFAVAWYLDTIEVKK